MMTRMYERDSVVRGVRVMELCHVRDSQRGDLMVIEFAQVLPFRPQRCFLTYAMSSGQVRGKHAHRECSQFLLSAHGACRLLMDDGIRNEEIILDRPEIGVLVPPMVWTEVSGIRADSVLLVLASHVYDSADYIRDYAVFLQIIREAIYES